MRGAPSRPARLAVGEGPAGGARRDGARSDGARSDGTRPDGRRSNAPGSARGGFVHEAALYASDDELLAVVVPFLRDGLAAGMPCLVALEPATAGRVGEAIGARDGFVSVPAAELYGRPATTVREVRERLGALQAAGAGEVRFVGQVPHPGLGVPWHWWGRYEAAINELFADVPLWAICAFDRRRTPETVLDEVRRTHPRLVDQDLRHGAGAGYEPPAAFAARRRSRYVDPLEQRAPRAELLDPTPARARRAVRALASGSGLAGRVEELELAVSEVVTNALIHGRPPVGLRLWSAEERLLAVVSDGGPGVRHHLAGLWPAGSGSLGKGLWLAHQLCDYVAMDTGPDGFAVRLVVGSPSLSIDELAATS